MLAVHVHVHRRLELARVRAAAGAGLAHLLVPVFGAQLPPRDVEAERACLEDHLPRRLLDERMVRAVAIDHHDPPEAVVRDRRADVDEEVREGVGLTLIVPGKSITWCV
jgi:hypothetical protein